MSTTKVGTVEMWYNVSTRKMESIIKESTKVIVSIPCPDWADKALLATEVEKESCRRVR